MAAASLPESLGLRMLYALFIDLLVFSYELH